MKAVDICFVEEYGRSGGSGFLLAVNIIIVIWLVILSMFIYSGDYARPFNIWLCLNNSGRAFSGDGFRDLSGRLFLPKLNNVRNLPKEA